MGSGGSSSWFPKIATILLAIAFLLHLIAIGSTWWARADPSRSDRVEHIGLWRYCANPIGGGEACGDFVEIIYGGECIRRSWWIFNVIYGALLNVLMPNCELNLSFRPIAICRSRIKIGIMWHRCPSRCLSVRYSACHVRDKTNSIEIKLAPSENLFIQMWAREILVWAKSRALYICRLPPHTFERKTLIASEKRHPVKHTLNQSISAVWASENSQLTNFGYCFLNRIYYYYFQTLVVCFLNFLVLPWLSHWYHIMLIYAWPYLTELWWL